MVWHPTVDLSSPVRVRAPVPIPEPVIVETPTFEADIPGALLLASGLSLAAGGFLGWTVCANLMATEMYQTWAKEIIFSVLPVRKLFLVAGIGHAIVEVVAKILNVEVPPEIG